MTSLFWILYMSWQDIERCCAAAIVSAGDADKEQLQALQQELGVFHSEATSALMVNVRICDGSKDLATHLRGFTMRVGAVGELIRILRDNG